MASVLAVVAGSPAQAANTADQYLVDGARPFAGSDRYDTALRLAKHFADNNTAGAIDTVIIASGETQIDAVAAAGLAGYEEAPVLLTRRDQLPKGVATFIEDQGVSRVFVLGGTKVVSDAVREQILGLDSSPTITPVAGPNRYATAAAAAGMILSTARWCGSDDSAVFLANGNQVPITSAIMAGPMSYRMQMPLLLTADDALPTETAEYIDDNNVDRVVIIGSPDEVSEDVADEIAALGASVDRVGAEGDDASAISVKVAELMWGDCDGLPTDTGHVALVNADATVDGVTGGPVAGRGLGNDDRPMAILLVGRDLPASVRDWLALTDVEEDGDKTHLSIVAIGGTKVVSNSVMAAAVEAATTAPGLTTSITVAAATRTGEASDPADEVNSFTVTFSDELEIDTAHNWKRQLSDVFYVNGQLASIEDEVGDINTVFTNTPNSLTSCVPGAMVEVTLTTNLKAGDRIEVRPTAHKFGKDGDQRLLQASSATVALMTSSTAAPTIEVVAIEGQSNLFLRSDGTPVNGKVHVGTRSGAKVTVADIPANKTADSDAYEPALTLAADFDLNKDGSTAGFTNDYGVSVSETGGQPYFLAAGDWAWAERGAFTNGDEEVPSRYTRHDVSARKASFRADSVLVGLPDTGVSGAMEITGVSERADTYIGRGTSATDPDEMLITGLWGGDAAGAAGNDWQIAIDSNANYNAAATTAEIDVSVGDSTGVAGGGLIRVQFIAGSPTLGDLAAALMGNDEFTDNFHLSYDCSRSRVAIDRTQFHTTSTDLTGGVSSVGIQVTWNDWVSGLMNADSTSESNPDAAGAAATTTATNVGGESLADNVLSALIRGYARSGLAAIDSANTATDSNAIVSFLRASKSAHIRYTSEDATNLPGPRTGPKAGAVEFGGNYYPAHTRNVATDGTVTYPVVAGSTRTVEHVALNYLFATNSDDATNDIDKDSDNFGAESATAAERVTRGSSATSEPYDPANSGQTIRARSGAVPSQMWR